MTLDEQAPDGRPGPGPRLGTFGGVFTPSILTILGIILFMRLGFVTGQAGLWRALVIIGLANVISVLTSFSLAAIATNFEVKGGGYYYLISRTLGPQFGGAIGIVLFLAQSISIAFYTIGLGEAVAPMIGVSWLTPQVIAAGATTLLFGFAWLGADWATRLQYLIMVLLFGAICAFAFGAVRGWDPAYLEGNLKPGGDLPFWVLFALFFPAVTGFTQGVSMSGDLKDPAQSLPRGTFFAVGLSMVIYFGAAVLFAGAVPSAELTTNYAAMRTVSPIPGLVDAGLVAATLSSALASFLGAPRILQSLASDRLVPLLNVFARGSGPSANPRRGIVLSGLIAAGIIAVGDLNMIAPIVSMFFLVSYGLLNYATFFEARSKSPSFRPAFPYFHERVSLVACIACIGAILVINPTAGAMAFVLLMAMHQFLGRAGGPSWWADSNRSNSFQRVRGHLLSMAEGEEHPRDWRPVILAFSNDPARRERLIRFASWIEGGSGLTTVMRILLGTGIVLRKECEPAEAELRREIREHGFDVFARVLVMPDLASGFPVLLQASGAGPIRPNTVLLNWFDQERLSAEETGLPAYGSYMRAALRHGCNVILLEATTAEMETLSTLASKTRRIDVWWRGDASSRLALMLAYLMRRGAYWERSTIRVLQPLDVALEPQAAQAELEQILRDVRIDAVAEVLPEADAAAMVQASADAAIVLQPFRLRDEEPLDFFGEPFAGSLEVLPVVALVIASRDIDLETQPDQGPRADRAAAVQAAAQAEERARAVEKELELATREHAKLVADVEAQRALEETAEGLAEAEAEVAEALAAVEQARRRAAKAQAKALHARADVIAMEEESP